MQYQFSRPALFSFSSPLEVTITGYDLDRLRLAAEQVRLGMQASPTFSDIKSTVEAGNPEIQIVFDQERAAQLGITVRELADRVVASVRGDVATRYKLREKKIDVLVRSVDTRASSVEEIRSLIVNPGSDRPLPLSAVAEVTVATGPAEIRRTRQQRVAIVSANLSAGDLGSAVDRAQRRSSRAVDMPVGVTAAVSGQSDDMKESFRSLQFTMLLAVFLVYLVMASQFESLLHPFVILLTIPLALVGSVWAMFLTGTTVNVVAYIGLIMLAGIVVNQSIVLIDAVNQLREKGLAKHDAIVEAARLRLRPIVITKLTTILGLLPMAIGLGEGAEIRKPMAITVIGGVAVASFFTLLVIPVVYSLLDRKRFQPRRPAGRTSRRARRGLSHDPHAIRAQEARHDADDLHRAGADRRHRDAPAAARAVPGHPLPGHPGHDPLRRFDARGGRAAHHAPGRGGDRDALGHQGDPLHVLRDGRRAGRLLPVGPRPVRGRVRGAHQARIDPPRIPAERQPHPDADVRRRRRPGGGDPHLEPGGPDAPVRHARPLPEEAARAPRRAWRASRWRASSRSSSGSSSTRCASPPTASTSRGCATRSRARTSRSAPARSPAARQRFLVRPIGEFRTIDDVRNFIVTGNVRLRDVADVSLVTPELTVGRHLNGRPGVGLDVFKSTGANIVDVAERVMAVVEEQRKLPQLQGIEVIVLQNQAENIRSSLSELRNAGLIGAGLALVVLFLFMRDWPTTLIVGLAVPFSLLITVAAMYFLGFSLNILTMMGMLLAIGLLVDNAVVVTESIFRHRQVDGADPIESTLTGVTEVGLAVLAGTLSTVIVFLPIIFGEESEIAIFMVHVAVPIVVAMLASLLVAQTLIPTLTARFPPPPPIRAGSFFARIQDWYLRRLDWLFAHKWWAALFVVLTVASPVPLFVTGLVKMDMFPQDASDRLFLPYHIEGTYPLARTEEAVTRVEQYLEANKERFGIDLVYSYYLPDDASSVIRLKPREELPMEPRELMKEIEKGMPEIIIGKPSFRFDEEQGQTGAFSMRLTGESTEELVALSRRRGAGGSAT